MEQDHPTIVPPAQSQNGTYNLVDVEPTPSTPSPAPTATGPAPLRAPATLPAPEPTTDARKARPRARAGAGLLGFLKGKLPKKAADAGADPATPAAQPEPNGKAPADGKPASTGLKLRIRRRNHSWRTEVPAWAVSLLVHLSVLSVLALATVAPKLKPKPADIDAAPVDTALSKDEELLILDADPTDSNSDQAVTPLNTNAVGLGTGAGAASATPAVATRGVGARTLPDVKVVPQLSPLQTMTPMMPAMDLAGGGQVRGDVTHETGSIGEALDQLAREILRHLRAHKLVVVWLFDESASMKDDQQAIKEKFDRVASELKINVGDDKKAAHALTHAIVGFGEGIHPLTPRPVDDIDAIGQAIDKIPVDPSGTENTCGAVARVIEYFRRYIDKERRMILVLVTDESGDDGPNVEEARQMAVSHGVPLYVIGRQSLFGYERAHLLYTDPVTKDQYWPEIRRGPETAGPECLQWDGLHARWDEQPSGFAPYELARLVKDTGGIYFLLPSEENMRVRQREKKYRMAALKEYVPDYKGRLEYFKNRKDSKLRSTLFTILDETREFAFRRHYPINPPELAQAAVEEYPVVQQRLAALMNYEQVLRALKVERDREPERRWRAHYDLMLAQIVTYQIKAYEYKACLEEMVQLTQKGQLKPSKMPVPEQLVVEWVLDHSRDRKAPQSETEKKYAEAESLLRKVIADHPNTPWADLAQDELDRGFGVQRGEWHHNPQYEERAKLVPHF